MPSAFSLRPSVPRLFHLQGPLEHRAGGDLGLPDAALRLHRLGHELRPGEQRLLRLLGFVVAAVDRDRCVPVPVRGHVSVAQDKLDRPPARTPGASDGVI